MIIPMSSSPKRVVIPNYRNNNSTEKYFVPRFIEIIKGEEIEWTNMDSNLHTLYFYSQSDSSILKELGPIKYKESVSAVFDYDYEVINYLCKDHGESGAIIIYKKELSNTEHLRFLQRTFNIEVPDMLKHLREPASNNKGA